VDVATVTNIRRERELIIETKVEPVAERLARPGGEFIEIGDRPIEMIGNDVEASALHDAEAAQQSAVDDRITPDAAQHFQPCGSCVVIFSRGRWNAFGSAAGLGRWG